jgi:hypothetical protein
VTDTAVRALPAAGTVDQFADSVRLLGDHTARRAAVAAVLGPIGNVAA